MKRLFPDPMSNDEQLPGHQFLGNPPSTPTPPHHLKKYRIIVDADSPETTTPPHPDQL